MTLIRFKKPSFPIRNPLRQYLVETNREIDVPVSYQDLTRYTGSITLRDNQGQDTLWETLVYDQSDRTFLYDSLKMVYALLKVGGDVQVIEHLYIDRVDYCLYANTHPIRVRIVNKFNDLFDYFYIKKADASRVYGMELEHLLSPNKINYLAHGDTLIEEHIQGIPGDQFIKSYLPRKDFNPLRLAKEFVKFNERSFVQLVGDMRNDNFVVEVIPDFDELYFRLRAIDFDQECFEGNCKIYLPQFFKENNPIIELGFKTMSPVLELQYQNEERMRLLTRVKASHPQLDNLLKAMKEDEISKPENVIELKQGLAEQYGDKDFVHCQTMGEIVAMSLSMLSKYPVRKRRKVRNYV